MENKLQILKGSIKSKTMWFNTILGTLLAAEGSIALLQPVLGDSAFGIVSFTLTVGNMFLRGMTNKALVDK